MNNPGCTITHWLAMRKLVNNCVLCCEINRMRHILNTVGIKTTVQNIGLDELISIPDELKELLRTAGNRLVVVEFSAKWCGPCKTIGPIFQAMSLKYQNVMFANVDVDSAKELTQLCNIRAVPTFQMFKHTQKVLMG
ncbi:thioredoxin domain-containing protein 8-like [Cricetulus griseus]|uniref:thioredoxin domain-containing protein 8-like n=1 Tax=Cricetulus griseus TaxID=10029 RepID=UPI0015C2D43C|nr:thioredoxin domain-containing protein 8-like [Cricetulus griseus]